MRLRRKEGCNNCVPGINTNNRLLGRVGVQGHAETRMLPRRCRVGIKKCFLPLADNLTNPCFSLIEPTFTYPSNLRENSSNGGTSPIHRSSHFVTKQLFSVESWIPNPPRRWIPIPPRSFVVHSPPHCPPPPPLPSAPPTLSRAFIFVR